MANDGKIGLVVHIPEDDFKKLLREYAPELSEDFELANLSFEPSLGKVLVGVRTNKKHTMDYLTKKSKPVEA